MMNGRVLPSNFHDIISFKTSLLVENFVFAKKSVSYGNQFCGWASTILCVAVLALFFRLLTTQ